MTTMLLWMYSDLGHDLEIARDRFLRKYGRNADTIWLKREEVVESIFDGLEVKTSEIMLKSHFGLSVESNVEDQTP